MKTIDLFEIEGDMKEFIEEKLTLKFKKLDPDAKLPQYKTEEAAGMDIATTIDFSLRPGEHGMVPTGLAVEIPKGFELQVRPRSGLAVKGITIVNSPGTIDSDFRSEIKVVLALLRGPTSVEKIEFKKGDRIAQLVLARVPRISIIEVEELSKTDRAGGFGSTGK